MSEQVTAGAEGEAGGAPVAGETILGAGEVAPGAEAEATAAAEAARVAALTPEEKAAEEAAAAKAELDAKGAPEKYEEFKTPENTKLDPAIMDTFSTKARELNLTQDKAQALLDWYAKEILPNSAAQQQEQWSNTLSAWKDASKSDKEFGGDKFDANIALAQRALNTFATPELGKYVVDSGLGNHPEFIRLMVRVGQSMSEDKFIKSNSSAPSGEKTELDVQKAMYPTMFK